MSGTDPITLDEESLALLQLNLIPGIGPRLQTLLLGRFSTAREIFNASGRELLEVDQIGPRTSALITAARDLAGARAEWEACREQGIRLIFRSDADYPQGLLETHDPPPVLYVRGDLQAADALAIGIVGSRRCTIYGRTQAERFATSLARAGVTVVSGLARGVDAAAHRGALSGGGRTLAVCAPGLDHIYPPEHFDLAGEIAQQGTLLTESPLHRSAQRGLFPQRNRIIAGLSLGVLIVEAGRGSGALHTARHAMEQGREVFALPGRIDSLASAGCHDLIRDGATLVRGVDDILEALGPLAAPVSAGELGVVATPRELQLNEIERSVLNLVDFAPTSIDQVLSASTLDASQTLSTLTVLEMRRLIKRLPGGHVERVPG